MTCLGSDYDPGYFGEVYKRFERYFWHVHGFPPEREEVFARAYRWARRREARDLLAEERARMAEQNGNRQPNATTMRASAFEKGDDV